MKQLAIFTFLSFALGAAYAQEHSIQKIWETEAVLKVPESVCPDIERKILYVSNIDGKDPWGADHMGSIARLGLDGKIIDAAWIRGLNAPKGMGVYKNFLYVADINEVAVIDIRKGEIKKRIAVPHAEALNDITIDPRGIVYVSDSKAKRIYKIQGNDASVHIESLGGPNGLLWHGDNLYVLDKGSLLRVEYDRKLTPIATGMEGGTDGLAAVNDHDFIVSGWAGIIYYVRDNGQKQVLADSRNDQVNTADIAFDAVSRTLYVPTFWKNKVIAYELK
jgi:hypothetical protein